LWPVGGGAYGLLVRRLAGTVAGTAGAILAGFAVIEHESPRDGALPVVIFIFVVALTYVASTSKPLTSRFPLLSRLPGAKEEPKWIEEKSMSIEGGGVGASGNRDVFAAGRDIHIHGHSQHPPSQSWPQPEGIKLRGGSRLGGRHVSIENQDTGVDADKGSDIDPDDLHIK
jgi:hypothetical protein